MEVNSVLDNLGLTRDFTEQAAPTNELGQDTFLRLFITQLEFQDPLDPTASEEFVAQLAQFSSLEQATQTTSLLEGLIAQGTERGRFEAVQLIGHQVLATGNTIELDSGGVGNLVYQLAGEISSGSITITDSTGKVVRSITLDTQSPGQQTIEWDGLDNEGEPVSPGVYQFAVNPLNAEGANVSVTTFLRESIKSAVFSNGQTKLILASGKNLFMNDVLSVY